MESLPSPTNKSSNKLTEHQMRLRERIVDLMAEGETLGDVAKRLGRGDKRKVKAWRMKIRRWAATDQYFIHLIAQATKGELVMGLQPIAQGVVRRGSKGRTDAAKLAFEASGFHSPRTMHEHSGEIKVSLDIPRPVRAGIEEPIVDAEVVED